MLQIISADERLAQRRGGPDRRSNGVDPSTKHAPPRRLVVPKQPSAGSIRVQRLGDGEKDARF